MHFEFINPGNVRVRSRIDNEIVLVDTSGWTWTWNDGGKNYHIKWAALDIHPQLIEILKAYIYHRFQTRSLITVAHDKELISSICNCKLKEEFPLKLKSIIELLNNNSLEIYYYFISFYKWAISRNIEGFASSTLEKLSEFKVEKRKPYAKVFLNPTYVTNEDESLIISLIDNVDIDNLIELRNNILLQICFELGPRPIQIYTLNHSDFNYINSTDGISYYSINLSMAKKISNDIIEKRPRSISSKLGEKIKIYIDLLGVSSIKDNDYPLFFKDNKNFSNPTRLPSDDISKIIINQLKAIGFNKGDGAKLLRHHLAQSLADQGAPADVIAEILGHNSTLPARAYIAATPEISKIKTKALGKSSSYKNIMRMLLTGEIIDKESVPKERWVKGLLGSQYIGGIGSCGLPENTACPKNPVYACYTCHKYHPFSDGNHDAVKQGLQKQAQFFLDHAEAGNDLKTNRAVIQLEKTIEAVDAVIERCKSHKK